MSNMIRLIAVGAALVSTGCANIISPAEGETWALNAEHEIRWDTEGLVEPLQVELSSGNSTIDSSSIATLAPTVPNTGKWMWQPTTSIPQHHNFQIIIIDMGGHKQKSPPFQMIGWPQQPPSHQMPPPAHQMPPSHQTTPPAHQLPPIQTPAIPPAHVMPPPAHVMPPPPPPPPMHTLPPSHVMPPPAHVVPPEQASAILVTSLIVQTLIHTSQPQPIIKTIESPPLVQTENMAPIILTQVQEPVTKIKTQPNEIMTEFGQPIIKTILVTETPAPIIKTLTRDPITMVESQAPIILTQTQAPIIKTLSQPPQLVTEHVAPVVMTSEITQTIHLTSFVHSMAPPAHTMPPPAHSMPPPAHVVPPPVHSVLTPAVPVHPMPAPTMVDHLSPVITTPLAPVHTPGAVQSFEAVFPNTTLLTSTSINVPAFTTPIKLGATAPGFASPSGSGLPPLTFVGAAPKNGVVLPCVLSVFVAMLSVMW